MKHSLLTIGSLFGALCLGQAPALADTIISVTETHYDANLRPDCVAVRMNPLTFADAPSNACTPKTSVGSNGPDRITQSVYDNAGQIQAVYKGVGTSNIIQYAYYNYTPNGLKAFEIDANHNKTTYSYDGFDRLSKVQYPNTTAGNETSSTTDTEQFAYDNNGNRTWWKRRNGIYIYYNYDNLNRQILTYPGNASVPNLYSGYDLQGHILYKRFVSASGSGVSYVYDALGNVTSTTDMNERTVSYLYNAAGARVQMNYPEVTATSTAIGHLNYTLDYLNRVTAMSYTLTSMVPILAQDYDNLGRRSHIYRGTTTATGSVATTTYGYDNLGRLTSLANDLNGTGYDVTWTFPTRNPAGQIVTWGATSTVYDYAETATATTNKTYDGLNRDASIAAVSGGYDTNGNLAKDGTRVITYDVYNRLLTVAAAATPTTPYLSLSYDPEGRLYQRSYGGTTDTYLYDGTNLIGEYSSGGTTRRRYIHGTGVDEPVVWLEGQSGATPRYLISNYQGSIIAYTDNTGVLGELYKYGPYGEPKNATNADSWSGSRFRYTGQTTLPEASLYYYKARVYDPTFGRFLQTDPVGSKDDLDLYAYVGGDPVNKSDPTGLLSCVARPNGGTQCTQDVAVSNIGQAAWAGLLGLGAAIGNAATHTYEAITGQTDAKAAAQSDASSSSQSWKTYYHGTSRSSAINILTGGLSASAAAANQVHQNKTGFYYTPDRDAADHFADVQAQNKKNPPAVLSIAMSDSAQAALTGAGATFSTISIGKHYQTTEIYLPPSAFPVFDDLRADNQIMIAPVR